MSSHVFGLDFPWISSYPLHLFSLLTAHQHAQLTPGNWDQQAAATKIWLTYSNWPTWNSLKRLASLRQVWWLRDIVIKRLHKTRLRVGGWVGVLLRFGFCSSWMRCNHITHTDTDIYEHTVLQPYQILFAKTSLDPTVDRKLKLHMNRYVWIWYWKHFKVGSPKSLVGVGKAHDVNQQNIKDWLLEEIWKWLQHKWASAKKHASDVFGHKFSKTILPNIGVL